MMAPVASAAGAVYEYAPAQEDLYEEAPVASA